jgi:hypothetical protein
LVLVLISCGLLPIYSLIRSGQQRISRADTRIVATMMGASALELARTLGYDKAQKLHKDDDFMELQYIADKNGYEILFDPVLQPVTPLPEGAKPLYMLRIRITVKSKHEKVKGNEIPDLTFVTILTDPRYNFY